ncbi:MAG: GAF domain-containing protein [Anaerolineae bacterium]|nr:GAF domain-containing protein [Anaerolineae bacterium]
MVSNPTQMLQAEVNRLRAENDALRNELYDLKQFVQALQSLADAEEKFHSNEDLLRFLSEIVRQTLDLLSAPDGSLSLLDPDTGELEFVIVHGGARDLVGTRLHPGEGVAGWVARHGRPVVLRDVRTDPRFSERIDRLTTTRTQSIAAAPLIGNGRVLGVVEVLNQPSDEPFSGLDQALLTLFCRFAGEALANIEQESDERDILTPRDFDAR